MTTSLKLLLVQTYDAVKKYTVIFASKRALARILSTFLCCVAVVVHPFSALGGNYAFLVLTLKELVFSVQASLAQQLELTVLNILGALMGIAVSTLAKFLAAQSYPDSPAARGTCAFFLVLICFFAGFLKSRLPRLQLSMRISCFVSVWMLTSDIGVRPRVLTSSGDFLWVTLTAAVLCLFSLLVVMSIIKWTSTNFERDIASTFVVIQDCLRMGLTLAFPHPFDPPIEPEGYQSLKADLLRRTVRLNENYSQAAFELRVGRLSLRSIRPLIGIVEHLRRELSWGMPLRKRSPPSRLHSPPNGHSPSHSHFLQSPINSPLPSPLLPTQNPFTETLEAPAQVLGNALIKALSCVEHTIILAFHQGDPPAKLFTWSSPAPTEPGPASPEPSGRAGKTKSNGWTLSQLADLQQAETDLMLARDAARDKLREVFERIYDQQHAGQEKTQVPKDALNCSLAMIALLQMAHEVRIALQVAQRFANTYETSHPRLWHPRFSLAWLGVPPGPFVSDDPNAQYTTWSTAQDDSTIPAADNNYAAPEWKQGLREHAYRVDVRRTAIRTARMQVSKKKADELKKEEEEGKDERWWEWDFSSWLDHAWSNTKTMRFRMRFWRFLKAVRHSSHLRHALKNACGVALVTFPAFLPAGSAGRKWFTDVRGQWMTISYLWVLETNTGATWRTGYLRILGTIFGAIYAYITWLICKRNPYGLVAMVTAADIPITWLIMQNNLNPLAVPASVALPPIVFAQYINPDDTTPISKLALLRAAMISAGMVAALLVNSLIFPRHCRVYFLSDTSRTIGLMTDLYMTLSHDIFQEHHALSRDTRRKTLKLELDIRNSLHRLSALITTMHNEIGLLPKPLRHYRRVVAVLQNILDVMTGLRKIRENIPRKITVADVFKERREFMSCICIALFACQHAFKAREPLPQFLPSARHAFDILEEHMQERIRRARELEHDPQVLGLSLVYAFAEQQVMRNMVDTLESLLDITGSLFGTSAWLTQDSAWSRGTVQEEGEHGWYSTFKWEEV